MYIDSSTLILLAKAGLLGIVLQYAKERLVMSKSVYKESTSKKDSFDAKMIEQYVKDGKIDVIEAPSGAMAQKLAEDFNINTAEAEVLLLSLKNKSTLVIDDKRAIEACKILGVKFITALNILAGLYRKKHLEKAMAMELLNKLRKYGRYSDAYIGHAKEELK